jgi:hypothetical protein
MTGREYTIWRDGPFQGKDRSTTLFHLAMLMLERGISPDDVFPILKSADERWGKFYLRDDGDKEIVAMIERAGARANV